MLDRIKEFIKKNKLLTAVILIIVIGILIIIKIKIGPINGKLVCTYKSNTNTMNNSFIYEMDFKFKNVTKLKTKELISSDDQELLKTYKESIEEISKKYDNLKYYDVKINQKDKELIVNTIIYYDKIDMKDYLSIEGEKTYIKNNKVKIKELKKIYEKNGAICTYK